MTTEATDRPQFAVVREGDVHDHDVDHALDRLGRLTEKIDEPTNSQQTMALVLAVRNDESLRIVPISRVVVHAADEGRVRQCWMKR